MSAKTGEAEDEAGKWLNMIARTSLLFNTKKELAEHIGYPALTNNNNLSKIKGDSIQTLTSTSHSVLSQSQRLRMAAASMLSTR